MAENIFVLGLDEHNRETLGSLPHLSRYRFHGLLTIEELQHEDIDVPALLERARAQLEAFDGTVDAIMGYWDFPVSSMVPILCEEYGLPSASLESVVKCEHKYWSRLEQREVIDELPGFAEVAQDATEPPAGLSYPMWLKPVKSFSSELAFRVTDDEEFRSALAEINEGAGRIGEPFEYVLGRVNPPAAIAEAGGTACLAEEEVGGRQVTVEGYVHEGEVVVYGVVDSLLYPDSPSFLRYQYPSRLPGHVTERLTTVSRRVVERLGLDSVTFNIEFFWDPETDRIRLLEVNPRHSQSHAKLFEYVDGTPNHECALSLALGRSPELSPGDGEYAVAAKWFLRRFEDGVVRRAPGPEDVARVEREIPGTTVKVVAHEGDRLSRLPGQDSYSYELAQVFVGARDEEELKDKYDRCVAALPFEIDTVGDAEDR
ncbi:Carbamoylphosphate synthase large subunit (split gene in MJ) [Marinactinospora thermotolerans DSM 45154]|uniref:Carbamoylphosphate synthase large subunit (Split gene in MJ) n=2 Tax=Marinactinospora thermotolerans TaxID=531310 RepID=A0A1T4T555_9ACTN|nr:ATP-grasp domain-containing protein [Marinactinospora thermotolerans]AET51841.1 putative uncharacterized protein [Marinactinospora thermotolerans]SKA35288.1 Carbamoylphosphate synthase large subunit (split gene in MJ) [Marinactinospora thermotolerans DSM 45154]